MGQGGSYRIGDYDIQVVRQLAEGGFSYVYLVQDTHTPATQYALKKILCQTEEQLLAAKQEIKLHSEITHPAVLQLLAYTIIPSQQNKEAQEALLLFPYYGEGSLSDLVTENTLSDNTTQQTQSSQSPTPKHKGHTARLSHKLKFNKNKDKPAQQQQPTQPTTSSDTATTRPTAASSNNTPGHHWPFTEQECLCFFLLVCQGCQAIHQAGYRHADIKPHNILLHYAQPSTIAQTATATLQPTAISTIPSPVLIDLGSCSPLSTTITSRQQALTVQDQAAIHSTSSYRPPELHDVRIGAVIDERADVWMLGCVLFYMSQGRAAFEDAHGVSVLGIISGKYHFEERINPAYVKALTTSQTTHTRPSASSLTSPPSASSPSVSTPKPSSSLSNLHYSASFLELLRSMLTPAWSQRPTLTEVIQRVTELLDMSETQVQAEDDKILIQLQSKTPNTSTPIPLTSTTSIASSTASSVDDGADWAQFDAVDGSGSDQRRESRGSTGKVKKTKSKDKKDKKSRESLSTDNSNGHTESTRYSGSKSSNNSPAASLDSAAAALASALLDDHHHEEEAAAEEQHNETRNTVSPPATFSLGDQPPGHMTVTIPVRANASVTEDTADDDDDFGDFASAAASPTGAGGVARED